MNKKNQTFNYENKTYLNKLEELHDAYYQKYILFFKKYIEKDDNFLDVGCGAGTVLNALKKDGYINGYGCDISALFIKKAAFQGLKNVTAYNGKKLPYKNNFFNLIGSFNVLEHTQEPEQYLTEQISRLKKDGYLIVACPNFLTSILKSPHPRINGIKSKVKNIGRTVNKIFFDKKDVFERIPPIIRKEFQYDDDAIVITNLLVLRRNTRKNNCKIIYESGFINLDSRLTRLIDVVPFAKYFMPSCFIVAQKLK